MAEPRYLSFDTIVIYQMEINSDKQSKLSTFNTRNDTCNQVTKNALETRQNGPIFIIR